MTPENNPTDKAVPDEIPQYAQITASQRAALDEYTAEHGTDRHQLSGGVSSVPSTTDASVVSPPGSRSTAFEIELCDEQLQFSDSYKTSRKHTYYYGVHVDGFRLTLEKHDTRNGFDYYLKIRPEE